MDPHTACAFKDIDSVRNRVIMATASPAKFPDTIVKACGVEPRADSLEKLKGLPVVNYPLAASTDAVREFLAGEPAS